MQNYSVYLTVGQNVRGVHTFETPEICEYVAHYLDIEAFTAMECVGMWRGECEKSTRIEICALTKNEADSILSVIPDLACALCQDSIMCEIRPDSVQFVESYTIEAMRTA